MALDKSYTHSHTLASREFCKRSDDFKRISTINDIMNS